MSQTYKRFLALLAVVALAMLGTVSAQTTKGTIAGVVTDKTGAVVTGATVTATPSDGGEGRSTTTGARGEYRIEALTPGQYTLAVSAPGFSTLKIEKVTVSTSLITSNNAQLAVASGNETVSVEATGEGIQTESGELSKTISTKSVKDLPYASLNAYQLATTLPGVVTVQGRDDFTNGTSFSVNGLRPRANNFLIDGFDNNDNGIGGQAFQPANTEAVQDVTVLTNSYAAEFGRGGGSVSNLTFRSGSNAFHGAAWEQYTGSRLNALTSEDSANGLTRPAQFVNNIFGFRLGGPIVKNKLFFFGTSQWNRFFGAQPASILTVPTADGMAILNSLAGNPNVDVLLNSFGNVVASQNNAGAVAIGARPGCPAPCNINLGQFQRTDSGASLSREWTVRTDYVGTNDNLYVRYTDSQGSLTPDLFANSGALPSQDTLQGGPSRILGTMWAHTFSPKVINEFRFSAQQINFTFGPTAATAASPNAHLPSVFFSDSLTPFVGGFEQATFPQGRGHKVYQFQDAVTVNAGAHTMKLGADLAVMLINDQIPFNSDGLITISGGGDCSAIGIATGCTDLANYIDGFLGPSGSMSRNFGNPRLSVPTTQQAYYFQDSWKARQNLTLDFGIRYEYQPPDASNTLAFPSVNPATIGTTAFQTRTEVNPDRNNFAPRFGFAYTPRFLQSIFGQDKTVIRGGYGMFYDAFFTNISDNTASASPNTLGGSVIGGAGRGPADPIGSVQAIGPTASPFTTITTVNNNLRNPLTQQWNLNVQRELPLKLQAEVAYVGTRGEHLWVNQQLNPRVLGGARVVPTRGSIVERANGGDSIYHGLQTTVSRSVGALTVRGSYTWSKSLDNMSEVFVTSGTASRWENVFDPRSDRGPSAFDRRHRAAISYVYDLPKFRNHGFFTQVLGGWSTSGVLSWQSGAPETISLAGWDQNGDGETANDRPDLSNPNAAINYSTACLSSATACSGIGFNDGSGNLVDWNTGAPGSATDFRYIVYDLASGVNGNVKRNSFYYPGRQDYNLSVVKRFTMPYNEAHNLEFRADLFNAFNHPNLGVSGLDGNINSPTFLNIDNTRRGGRSIALWAKYSF
jgi:hypothetical protein